MQINLQKFTFSIVLIKLGNIFLISVADRWVCPNFSMLTITYDLKAYVYIYMFFWEKKNREKNRVVHYKDIKVVRMQFRYKKF